MKPIMNKLNWKHGDLIVRVEEFKEKLKEAQSIVEKDPYNKEVKFNDVEALFVYNEVVKDEENLLAQEARVECEDLFSNVLSNDEAEEMIKEVSDKEIKVALFDIGDNKAPGPDGFSSVFFKKAWNVVGKDVCDGIKEFFSKGQMLGELNATLITLIPKIQNPLKVSDFKPIACCNVLYKCINKILTNRIKGALKKLVQNNQSSFIPGRLIQDNILLSQEILRGYGRKNGPKRCAIKIDLQKAYDTISWSFLETILYRFGFHSRMVGWIMQCVQTAGFTICINGERHGYFKGDRGLRQGDPISSYLFTLVMEMLALLLQRKIRNSDGFKYHHGCKELKIINLCFADDLMIFCHGDIKSPGVINDAIKEFSVVSGLHPNMNKSSLLIGSRTEDWKCKSLSYAGRLLLIASILESISTYWASVFKLPKTMIKEINGIFKIFLWSNGDSVKGKAKLAWKHVYTLWVKWVHSMRLKEDSIWNVQHETGDSWNWKCLLEIRDRIASRMQFAIGDGKGIHMWTDKWQKSYADRRRKPLEFEVGDKVMLKVSPWKGVIRFGKRGKLNPRYIGPFKIIAKVGTLAYRLELPEQLSRVHSTFHVSNLKKCFVDEPLAIPLDEIQIDDKLHFIKEPVEIMDREVKRLKQSRIPIVKVRWNSRRGPEFTWEREDQMKKKYPHLFANPSSTS
ncbi:RNA-directed DNA polymerase, eukaryota, reverse transcriptase zinc-binding domain protein [Tanacetum coccineum]